MHSYAPFLVERPYEQVKLDLGHQDVGAVLVSTGASYDGARRGAPTRRPATSRCSRRCRAGRSTSPGIPMSSSACSRAALRADDRVYIRMSEEANRDPVHGRGLQVLRRGSAAAPDVVAVGPTLDQTLAATLGLDVTVAYWRPCGRSTPTGCARW